MSHKLTWVAALLANARVCSSAGIVCLAISYAHLRSNGGGTPAWWRLSESRLIRPAVKCGRTL